MKQLLKIFTALFAIIALPGTAGATIIYDTWVTNENGTGNYELTVTLNGGLFDIVLTVDPWNAEALGLFVDLGDLNVTDNSFSTADAVTRFATDATGNNCGPGCNLNGLNPSPANPDGDWEWVFRVGTQGFNAIQTVSLSIAANGATEDSWGIVGIRAQNLCPSGSLLPDGNCGGSDKVYGSSTPTKVSEPGTLGLMGAGLLGFALLRRRRDRANS